MPTRNSLPESLRTGRILPIVRSKTGAHLIEVCDALVDAGIRTLELTTNTPGAAEAVSRFVGTCDVGMGTVRTLDHLRASIDAGATFIVTPSTSLEVGQAALEAGLGWYPGAMTPTEIETAWAAGATAVKVFPAGSIGGPGYLRDILAPLDDIRVIPTGGVTTQHVPDYFAAGAVAVGLGSPLIGDAIETGDVAALRERARAVIAAERASVRIAPDDGGAS